ncbi:Protein RIC1-like protein [Aphelenchoides besseyi]|nr:Protein RIC1-like protein [Aphelenchoides besseyi]KAI6194880.1 Protein RIC1-like protein [Aphelenchoides besseyi]
MFVPDDCAAELALPFNNDQIEQIVGNRERLIIACVTPSALYFFLPNPLILLCTYRRDEAEVAERGRYKKLYWRHNSASICVTTDDNYVYIYTVDISPDVDCFNIVDKDPNLYVRTSPELYFKARRPKVDVRLSVVAKLESSATCIAPLRDELFVCLKDGWIHRLTWSGDFVQELSFHICRIPFCVDQVTTKTELILTPNVYIKDFIYCPLMGGICMVLSDGRAALLVSSSQQFAKDSLMAIWVLGLTDATCCAANHKFRLIYFGRKNGDISAYSLDDTNGAMTLVFNQKLFVKNGTEFLEHVGAVHQVHCVSLGGVFAAIWDHKLPENRVRSNGQANGEIENGPHRPRCPPVLAMFSPFGAQWWCSLEDVSDSRFPQSSYLCMEWGIDGFQIWLGLQKSVIVMNLVHSVQDCLDRVALVGSDRVHVSPRRNHEQNATAPQFVWRTFNLPYEYIGANWPIRFVGFDADCKRILVVAGARGLCYFGMKTGKWRLFRKEAQEKALFLTGGLAVFEDFILAAGCDTSNDTENIFIFHQDDQLDLDTADKLLTNRTLMMNGRQNHLITFDVTCLITIFGLHSVENKGRNELDIQKIAEIRINELLPHPTCVVSIQLTSLNYYQDAAEFGFGMDSLLVNVSGHLLLLSSLNKPHPNTNEANHFQLHPPMLIASNVERTWVQSSERNIPHLNKALWINTGSRKMKVWLPLAGSAEAQNDKTSKRTFISRRIMIPVDIQMYPLAIDEDCLACGVQAISLTNSAALTSTCNASVHCLSRDCEVFMHRLLKQLLKRNLGSYALEIASACRCLPYFGHILELLLHDVLEEEATSSEPIPEPLLPRVVSFINEFPEYLETIVHCARKTELAIRNHLFTVSHHPRELFRMCLEDDQLDTATSCLIVLQSMESAAASVQYATTLLEEALTKRRWTIARDIVRFLQSIDRKDFEDEPQSPFQKLQPRVANKQPLFLPDGASEDYGLVFNSSAEAQNPKTSVSSQHPPNVSNSSKPPLVQQTSFGSGAHSPPGTSAQRMILNRSGSISQSSNSPSAVASVPNGIQIPEPIVTQMSAILNRHAHALLENFGIRDLAAFAAHLNYDMVAFFRLSSSAFSASPDQFPLILMKLHAQFAWPYPLASEFIVTDSPSSSATISVVDETSSLSSEDIANGISSSASAVTLATNYSNSTTTSKHAQTDFNRKVFEKLCEKTKSRGTEQTEDEIVFIQSQLVKAGALEWILLFSIMRRGVHDLSDALLKESQNLNRLGAFLKCARKGMAKLVEWADNNCVAYSPVLDLFQSFIEMTAEPQLLRKISQESKNANHVIESVEQLKLNGTIPMPSATLK